MVLVAAVAVGAAGIGSGPPRTAGYWMTWNRCAAGNQAALADRNGGWREGYWLLEDALREDLGAGVVWDDGLEDGLVVRIEGCEQAVEILGERRVVLNGVVGDGPRVADDLGRTVAMQLLTAQLNAAAGACTTPEVKEVLALAERLLDRVDFDGTSAKAYIPAGSPHHAHAKALAGYLEAYNRCECDFGRLPAKPRAPAG